MSELIELWSGSRRRRVESVVTSKLAGAGLNLLGLLVASRVARPQRHLVVSRIRLNTRNADPARAENWGGLRRMGYPNVADWRRNQWVPAVRAAGLSHRLTPYSMRHTFISWAIVTPGMSMFEIAKMAGTSAAQIEKTYAHLLRGHADRWRTALDAYDQGFGHLVDTGGK